MTSSRLNTPDKPYPGGLVFMLIMLVSIGGCGPLAYESDPGSWENQTPSPVSGISAMMGGGHPTLGVKRGLPETYQYKHFYHYRESPERVMNLLADMLKHNDYPDVKKDPFTMTIVTGAKPHDSMFVKMTKGDIRTRITARADRRKGKTVLALYICVEQKGRDGVWRVIDIPSNQLDMIDSANYETYFHTLEGYLKPKKRT